MTKALNYYIIDVFTNQRFSGAQVAVFPHASDLNDSQMATLAKELNLSETVFVSQDDSDKNTWKMRTFSPLKEIDYAGHPIIATAYALGECGDIRLAERVTAITLIQNTGKIETHISVVDGKVSFVQFTDKVNSVIDRFTPPDAELADILSISATDIDHKKFATRLVSCGYPYLIVPVWKYETVREATFNYTAWSHSSAPQSAAQEILLFSPKTVHKDSNFHARLLGPNIGIHSDPAVGSAMPAFASYLASFDFTQEGTHTFAVDRGDAEHRRSVINIEMDHKTGTALTLRIGGEAVMVAEGTMFIPQ